MCWLVDYLKAGRHADSHDEPVSVSLMAQGVVQGFDGLFVMRKSAVSVIGFAVSKGAASAA